MGKVANRIRVDRPAVNPCHGQISDPQSTVPVDRSAPRWGHVAGTHMYGTVLTAPGDQFQPATEVPNGRLRMASLAANAYQLPLAGVATEAARPR